MILEHIRGLGICGRCCIWIVQKTLNASENGADIECRGPSVLQDVETQLATLVNVGMKHLRDKLYHRWFCWVLLVELDHEFECAILEWGVFWADNDGIPAHDIVSQGYGRYSGSGILLDPFEVPHQALAGRCRHIGRWTGKWR